MTRPCGSVICSTFCSEIHYDHGSLSPRRPVRDPLVSLYDALRARRSLLAKAAEDRKAWIEQRLQELAQIFAVGVGGFSVMDNHLHVLLRLDPDVASGWSDEEVVRRWGRLVPPRDKARQPLPVCDNWVQWCLKDARWVKTIRERLQSLSWFMKCLKEPLARLANRQDEVRAAFFEKRFKSVAVLDEEALLAICAYIDLNPVAAGVVPVPEASPHTSIFDRLGSTAESWWGRLEKLAQGRLLGGFFASSRARLREVAQRLGVRHVANLGGCPAR